MITKIEITGFKSFHDFAIEFAPFTAVAGTNASGKSNLFDALELLSRLAESNSLKKAFSEQRGELPELFTRYDTGGTAATMAFAVEMLVERKVVDAWGNQAELKYTRLRYELKIRRVERSSGIEDLEVVSERLENLKHNDDPWFKRFVSSKHKENYRPAVQKGKRGQPYMETTQENNIATVLVRQDGKAGNIRRFPLINATRTVLSSFDTVEFPHVLAAKEEMRRWKFMQLNPEHLRLPTPKHESDQLTASGKNLASTLFRLRQDDEYSLTEISRNLQVFLPNYVAVEVTEEIENKQFIAKLKDRNQNTFTSRVLSEGTLRMLALCVLESDPSHKGLLCFEEPENGIHPARIPDMAKLLQRLSADFDEPDSPLRQVIVNTHSPLMVEAIDKLNKPAVSILYAEMKTAIAEQDGKKLPLSKTKITPKDKESQTTLSFYDDENKYTLAKMKELLSHSDFEKSS